MRSTSPCHGAVQPRAQPGLRWAWEWSRGRRSLLRPRGFLDRFWIFVGAPRLVLGDAQSWPLKLIHPSQRGAVPRIRKCPSSKSLCPPLVLHNPLVEGFARHIKFLPDAHVRNLASVDEISYEVSRCGFGSKLLQVLRSVRNIKELHHL